MAGQQFDYVVVGAGSAGCVLANRLSADPDRRVALLEAGGPDRSMNIRIPAAFTKLFTTPYDWNYRTGKQAELSDRELYWPRGRMLGGSSSMNAQMWVRGHRADYDGWGPGWTYDEVLPYFHRAEHRAGSNTGGVYGTDGPLWISELRDQHPGTAAFLRACAELGLTRLAELNGPDHTGYAPTPVTQRRGRRWSAADGYLRPAMRRPNLTVLTHASARRVVLSGDGRATGVEYRDATGATRVVGATREVVLSAGAVNSPHLLMLSGIGDPEHLRAAGVEVRREVPGVGANLQDHLAIAATVSCPLPVTMVAAETPGQLVRYLIRRKGMLTSNVAEAVAFLRTDPAAPAPDVELIWAPVPFIDHGLTKPPGHGVTIGVVLLQPRSRGRVTLAGADPDEPPVIDPGYLTAPGDLAPLVAGLRTAERLLATEALRPYVGEPMDPWPGSVSDAELAQLVRDRSETLYHPVGTCAMGTVVDDHLRVHGVPGLRVVDASVMPRIIRGHTHAPTVMIAERAADLLRADA